MDFNWILIWISGVSTALNLAVSLRNRQSPAWGWRAVLTSVLLLMAVLWLTVPQMTGFVIGPIWFLFVLLPGLLIRRVNRMLTRRKHRRAYWLSRVAGWLHPCDGWPQQTQLVRALWLFEEGKTTEASAIISRLGAFNSSLGRTARLIQAQQTGDWQSLLDEIDRRYSTDTILHDEALLIARTQALGELGRTPQMLMAMKTVFDSQTKLAPLSRAILQMRVAALCGQVAATDRQLSVLTQTYADDVRTYWLLTARQVAGEKDIGDSFRQLQETAGPYLRPMIERRLSQPLPQFDRSAADPQTAAIIDTLIETIGHDAQYAIWNDGGPRKPWMTWAIAAVLIGNFLREVPGGSENSNNLIDLGALIVPQSLTPGEWWRVLTAGFLHFGPLHLGLNLLGLLALAPRLERAWGRLPMLVCYLAATFTSMALAPSIMSLADGPPIRILVGASGGMMGLLGGLVGFLLVGWLRHRDEQTQKPLTFLLMIIALQTTFDLTTPNVSFAAHTLGLATGATFGLVWTWLTQRRKTA